jgi:plasmid stabilization system protein ParE
MASHPKPVIISPKALDDLNEIYDYIFKKFGRSSLLKFDTKWKEFMLLISYNPAIFPYLNKRKNLRKHTIKPRNLIIYRNQRNHVEIITIFNSAQAPSKLRKLK